MADLSTLWQRATVAEMCWLGSDGPEGLAVVPLWLAGQPCVALPYSHFQQVRDLDGRPAAFCVTRTKQNTSAAGVATGRLSLLQDPEGEIFLPELLAQEIVKFPPTRLLADGLMAQRDNWWWVGRMILTLTVEGSAPLPGRDRPGDAVLVRSDRGRPAVSVVSASHWPGAGSSVSVVERAGADVERGDTARGNTAGGDAPAGGAAVTGAGEQVLVFGHHRSPDAERWEMWQRRGTLHGDELRVTEADGDPAPALPALSLAQRYRTHRRRSRECRRGLAAARSASP